MLERQVMSGIEFTGGGSGGKRGCRGLRMLGGCQQQQQQAWHFSDVVAIAFCLIIRTSLLRWNNNTCACFQTRG